MHQEIRLHGHINDTIEYFATAAARDAYRCYFYETKGFDLRFFSPGNEFVLGEEGISHRGNGGSFCEYMFGVDLPLADLAKGDVRNRLVLYGATFREDGSLSFSGRTEGSQSYEKMFFEGNAVCNYFFFLTGSVAGTLPEQQEGLLRLLGKLLKRSPGVSEEDDADLVDEILGLLGHKSSLYLIKLIHKKHKIYHDAFNDLYQRNKSIPEEEFGKLQHLAESLGIDEYQQERIRINVMYKHPDNRRIVDEYKNILIDCNLKGSINQLENARLTRLKTLSVRNKIPSALFYTLDEMLKHDNLVDLWDQDYIAETRQILEGLFLHSQQIDAGIDREDMIKLLRAKRRASENRDHTFEQILLETGKACDEKIRDGADLTLLESFSAIITYFDRYDNASAGINQLAFMENVRFSEELIRSLLGNRKAFAELSGGLFKELFFTGILENKYLGQFGRKKVLCLEEGLNGIEDGRMTVQGLLRQLKEIDRQERLAVTLRNHVKDRIRNFYSRYNTRAEQDALRTEITDELRAKGLLEGDIPMELFRNVVVNIKKEAIYLHNLLPRIIADRDTVLREDFLDNSGLDRFYVEELEREYFELNDLPMENLYQIRKGFSTA
ncbi:TIGR04442 family protein [Desulfuromonas sp. TF]|uniref:TIGR04442 family protein n=1 Tax=Desulfuromonas sp. TF TaxID=1232410 RepID=UPI0004111104|nr:TIGR04442 family protein [Desulfuromonas sp. TF]